MVPGAMWAATVAMWDVAASMTNLKDIMWAVTSSM